jgi:hypothetical protein
VKVRSYLSGLALAGTLLVGGCAASTVPQHLPYTATQQATYDTCMKTNGSPLDATMGDISIHEQVSRLGCQNNVLQADLAAMHAAPVGNEVK